MTQVVVLASKRKNCFRSCTLSLSNRCLEAQSLLCPLPNQTRWLSCIVAWLAEPPAPPSLPTFSLWALEIAPLLGPAAQIRHRCSGSFGCLVSHLQMGACSHLHPCYGAGDRWRQLGLAPGKLLHFPLMFVVSQSHRGVCCTAYVSSSTSTGSLEAAMAGKRAGDGM